MDSESEETPPLPDEDGDDCENPEYFEGWNTHEQVDDRMP